MDSPLFLASSVRVVNSNCGSDSEQELSWLSSALGENSVDWDSAQASLTSSGGTETHRPYQAWLLAMTALIIRVNAEIMAGPTTLHAYFYFLKNPVRQIILQMRKLYLRDKTVSQHSTTTSVRARSKDQATSLRPHCSYTHTASRAGSRERGSLQSGTQRFLPASKVTRAGEQVPR